MSIFYSAYKSNLTRRAVNLLKASAYKAGSKNSHNIYILETSTQLGILVVPGIGIAMIRPLLKDYI
jgi:hypothetical protein